MLVNYKGEINRLYIDTILVFFLSGLLILEFGINQEIFLFLNSRFSFLGDWFWVNVTNLGDGFVSVFFVLVFIKDNPKKIGHLIIAGVLCGILVALIKNGLSVQRPPAVFSEADINILGPAYKSRSFPSGHSATIAVVCAVGASGVKRDFLRFAYLLIALVVCLSRIAVGVHWPMDIIIGYFLGCSIVYFTLPLINRMKFLYSGMAVHTYLILSVLIGVGVIFIYRTGYREALLMQRVLTAVMLLVVLFKYHKYIKHRNAD